MLSIERYLNIRSAYAPSFTADGRRIVFVTNITGVPQLWAVPATGGWPEQLTFYRERISRGWCSPTADQLVFAMDAGGNEHMQLHLLATDGAWTRPLASQDTAMHAFGEWSRNGQFVAFSANQANRAQFDVYVQPASGGEAQRLLEGTADGQFMAHSWSPDGQSLLIRRVYSPTASDLFLLELPSRALRHLTPDTAGALIQPVGWQRDGRSVFCITNSGREFASLVRLDLATGTRHPVAEPDWDVEWASISAGGRRLAYTVNEAGSSTLYLHDLATGRSDPVPQLPRGVMQSCSWHGDHLLALALETPQQPLDIWTLWPLSPQTQSSGPPA